MPAGKKPVLTTVRDRIAWSYANLACAHSALRAGRTRHATIDWIVRARLFKGLRDDTMKLGSLFDDERLQLLHEPYCVYCGSVERLSIDHLIPQLRGGTHHPHNLVRACRSCNSSKGALDLLEWYGRSDTFSPLMLLRRYIKVVAAHCEAAGIMDEPLDVLAKTDLPFDLRRLPTTFPPLTNLRM